MPIILGVLSNCHKVHINTAQVLGHQALIGSVAAPVNFKIYFECEGSTIGGFWKFALGFGLALVRGVFGVLPELALLREGLAANLAREVPLPQVVHLGQFNFQRDNALSSNSNKLKLSLLYIVYFTPFTYYSHLHQTQQNARKLLNTEYLCVMLLSLNKKC